MLTSMEAGKTRRLKRLIPGADNRFLLVPLDDSLIFGPKAGLEYLDSKLLQILAEPPDAIMGFGGLLRRYIDQLITIPFILNLSVSTVRSTHTRKIAAGTVDDALELAADGVAVHVNVSSKFEAEMLQTLSTTVREAGRVGMPVLAIMYPRSEGTGEDNNYEDLKLNRRAEYADLVAHAARIGVEMGADIIKTQYTSDPESFQRVVEICGSVPVVAAGGPRKEIRPTLEMACGVLAGGAAGISFGRNVFHRDDSRPIVSALRALVHGGESVDEIIARMEGIKTPR